MFGLQWIDRKYIAINSNTTPISDRFTCQKEVEFVILSAIFLPFSDLNTLYKRIPIMKSIILNNGWA